MELAPGAAAAGVRLIACETVGSTNAEALARAHAGEKGPLWVTARTQTAGHGRRGRTWVSEAGNLYATLLLTDPSPPERAAQLSFVAALATHDAIAACAPALAPRLAFKWPNDVLLDGAKVAGILIEAEGTLPLMVAVGVGVNCGQHPQATEFPATDLAAAGAEVAVEPLFAGLSLAMVERLRQWEEGFAGIRAAWLAHAGGLGGELTARLGARELTGRFEALDEAGRLLLRLPGGSLETIAAGEVFPVAPPGGVGEIGMNLSLYGLGREGARKWIAVDLGVAFAGDDLPGIDLIMPDIRYLLEERHNLLGLVLTHAHEDHFGAVLDLWPRLRVPVYATPFTAALFEAKRLAEPGASEVPINVVQLGARFTLGGFDVELVSMSHSIPESNGLIIRTPLGTVLHTGDWKLDPTPVIGPATDEAKLRALGQEGCLALVGDSTNAVRDGRSPSESDVAKCLADLIRTAPARVAVTTFASNVARLRVVADAAAKCEREVVVVGRAMERIAQVARETGYLDGIQDFRSVDIYGHLPPDKVLALCTGSQGEPRAALSRIAQDDHPEVAFSRGDRVIFSSRAIPGNEKAVMRVINGLASQGIEVITDRTHLVHVSGHPRVDELKDMIGWVRPQILVPVHGEPLHMAEHGALARRLGVGKVVLCRDGELLRLAPGGPGKIDELPAGRLYKDGSLLVSAEERTVADRRRLRFAGVVSVALAIDDRGELVGDPQLTLTGIPDADARGEKIEDLAYDAAVEALRSMPRARRRDPEAVAEAVRRAVRAALSVAWNKKPTCHVHVLEV